MNTFKTEDGHTFTLQHHHPVTGVFVDTAADSLSEFFELHASDINLAFDITLSNGYHFQVTANYEGDKLHTAIFDAENDHEDTIDAESVEGLTKLINQYAEL